MSTKNRQKRNSKKQLDNWVILDLDDTLVDTSDIYYLAREKFLKTMASLGFSRGEVLRTFERVETKRIRESGIFPERYAHSMIDSYRILSAKNEENPSIREEELLRTIGNMVVKSMPKPLSGAITLLKWLHKHYFVVLITRGTEYHQRRKIKTAKLDNYMDKYFIVKEKSASTLSNIAKELGRDIRSAWLVGDSVKSDINPGLAAGARCILYEYRHKRYYWRQEYGEEPTGEYFLAKTLAEVRQIMEKPHMWEKRRERLFRRNQLKADVC